MSKKTDNSGITRRGFLKTTGFVAAGAASVGAASALQSLKVDFARANEPSTETTTVTSCSWSCSFCQYNTIVRDGRVVRAEPIPGRYEKMCLKGRSRLGRTYSEERIKYPMKRAGERGENKWERISWEEAIDTIVSKWKATEAEYGPHANSWYTCSGTQGIMNSQIGIWRRFFNGLEATIWQLAYDQAQGTSMIRHGISWANFNEPMDWPNSDAIIVWGSNPVEANIQSWKYLADAKEAGVKLITVDPLFSATAAKSDMWVRPYPGTDAALALGICKYLVDEDKIDWDFLVNHSTSPVLINPETKRYLRLEDVDPAAAAALAESLSEETAAGVQAGNPPVAWDDSIGKPVPINDAVEPRMTNIPAIEGIGKVKTAWEACVDHLQEWTFEKVEEISEVPKETVIELADICASGNNYHYINMGSGAHSNGLHANHAYCWIAILTGNFGKPGASYGGFDAWWGDYFGPLQIPTDGKTGPLVPTVAACEIMQTGKYLGEEWPVKNVWITHGNILGSNVNRNKWVKEFFEPMEFIVVCDIDFSEDARYADIVLPAPHIYEYEDVVTYDTLKYIKITEKAIDPLYECIPEFELVNRFCDEFGLSETVGMTADEYWHEVFHGETNRKQGVEAGVTIEALREQKRIRFIEEDCYIGYQDLKFFTETGRTSMYQDQVVPRALVNLEQKIDEDFERLPRYFDNPESSKNSPLAEKYPFIMFSWRNNIRVHTNGYMRLWSRDVRPEPIIWINPDDAESIGVKNHDYVELYNDRGHVVLKAVLSESMRPGVICYPKGYQSHECVEGSLTEVTTDYFDPCCVNCSFMDNRVAIRVWEGKV